VQKSHRVLFRLITGRTKSVGRAQAQVPPGPAYNKASAGRALGPPKSLFSEAANTRDGAARLARTTTVRAAG